MWRPLLLGLLCGVAAAAQQPNVLTPSETAAGWRLLFDGKTTTGWHPYGNVSAGAPTRAHGWDVIDGTLVALGKGITSTDDIVTDDAFSNFELELDWKVAPQANSGIFYGVVEGKDGIYATGPEYQLIDEDGWPDPLETWQRSGADYAMHPPRVKAVRPVGDWNHTRIVVNGTHVELWLNGQVTASFERWTPEWRAADIGAANGHGNARSIAIAQSAISNGGVANGVRLLSQATIDRIFEVQADGIDQVLMVPIRFGIGYGLSTETMPFIPVGRRVCAWGGWGGSVVVNDLDRHMTITYVMNRMEGGLVGDFRGSALVEAALAATGG